MCFKEQDDYILQNYAKTRFLKMLVEQKGKDRVEERQLFLDDSN